MRISYRRFFGLGVAFFMVLAMSSETALARPPVAKDAPQVLASVPDVLRPWADWVLADLDYAFCPRMVTDPAQRQCVWHGKLSLSLRGLEGQFVQQLTLFDKGWVVLPGDSESWPQQVTTSTGAPVAVLERDGRPAVWLEAGDYTLQGGFRWREAPEMMGLPPEAGLIEVERDGVTLAAPEMDGQHRLWLRRASEKTPVKEAESEENTGDALHVRLFRLLTDNQPASVETIAMLDVSGKPREEMLKGMVLEGFRPASVQGGLPVRLEEDGSVRVRVKPGRWEVRVEGISTLPLTTLKMPSSAPEKQEIWAFVAQPSLRVADITGPMAMDVSQTEMAKRWRNLPAYLMTPDTELEVVEKKRGYAVPEADDLTLARVLRLDMAGDGITIEDRFRGAIRRVGRLNAQEGLVLGKVDIQGQNQLITRTASGEVGVEIRPGHLQMGAEGRYEGSLRSIPAVGWQQDVQSLSAMLALPAGWSLLAATGVDRVSQSWLDSWSLYDVFLVLMAALVAYKLLGRSAGILALVTLILVHPEFTTLTSMALTILAAYALVTNLPDGKFRSLARWVRRLAILFLLFTMLPFALQHVRYALYPQLLYSLYGADNRMEMRAMPEEAANDMMMEQAQEGDMPMRKERAMQVKASRSSAESMDASSAVAAPMVMGLAQQAGSEASYVAESVPMMDEMKKTAKDLYAYDAKSPVQTGFGVPTRQLQRIDLMWNGPVKADQAIHLWLLSPWQNKVLALVRVALMGWFFVVLLGCASSENTATGKGWRSWLPRIRQALALGLIALVGLSSGVGSAQAAEDDYPPQPLLDTMRARLQAELDKLPECSPNCAVVARTQLDGDGNRLRVIQEIHVGEGSFAVAVPGALQGWRPVKVWVNGAAVADGVRFSPEGQMQLILAPGVQQVVLEGSVAESWSNVSINLPLMSYATRVNLQGWDVQGIEPSGRAQGTLQLVRSGQSSAPAPQETAEGADDKDRLAENAKPLPPFYRVDRMIDLGTDWKLLTVVHRLTGAEQSSSVQLPLLPGEVVTSSAVQVKDDQVAVRFAAGELEHSYTSVLSQKGMNTVHLEAPAADADRVETWQVVANTQWHIEWEGLTPMVPRANGEGLPTWRPWPGEAVTVTIAHPEGADGPTRTLQSSHYTIEAGERSMQASLAFEMAASLGGKHTIVLPEAVTLRKVRANGQELSVEQKDREVVLPVVPGQQHFMVEWEQGKPISQAYRLPEVSLGAPSVNAEATLTLPRDRWVVAAGGVAIGPAVLFWSWFPLLLLGAWALAQVPGHPLRFHHWLLLLLGLSQTNIGVIAVVAGWVLVLGWRGKTAPDPEAPRAFNLRQILLVLWTFASLLLLLHGIQHGLLGMPDMKIAGNGSSAYDLHWYQDIVKAETLPQPWVLSFPMWVYRALMLMWALWLAAAMVRWLRWGWKCFVFGGYWLKPKTNADPS